MAVLSFSTSTPRGRCVRSFLVITCRILTVKQEHLFELELELAVPVNAQPFYVIYPDETGGNWRVQAVSVSPESFESRKALPEPWRGVRDDELSQVAGIEGCVFVHASGFIGGNKTKEGALEMAKRAVHM